MERVISRCCGRYVCEPVQEQIGKVLAKMWALKARLNQPIVRQVQEDPSPSLGVINFSVVSAAVDGRTTAAGASEVAACRACV